MNTPDLRDAARVDGRTCPAVLGAPLGLCYDPNMSNTNEIMYDIEKCGIHLLMGEAVTPPKPDNDNWGVASKWQTPAEALQMIRRMKDEMRRELRGDFRLRSCPTHRLRWETLIEAEKCALWHYYGVR